MFEQVLRLRVFFGPSLKPYLVYRAFPDATKKPIRYCRNDDDDEYLDRKRGAVAYWRRRLYVDVGLRGLGAVGGGIPPEIDSSVRGSSTAFIKDRARRYS
ncbi:hypothetical protein RRG08_049885 [Elysia crispata]|uniref:Uncharacterized protein n=1 Tax=Elysia crispata TaxID=231223 RepID=A0AAE1CPS6_9GAST|nr:hypothetical protein RRG08_049885 [Elysia crispata]